jgi:hypothetical protein
MFHTGDFVAIVTGVDGTTMDVADGRIIVAVAVTFSGKISCCVPEIHPATNTSTRATVTQTKLLRLSGSTGRAVM